MTRANKAVLSPKFFVFCDLDGTLVMDNSFHIFLAALWKHGDFATRTHLFIRLFLRIFGRFSGGHQAMKRRVLSLVGKLPRQDRDKIIEATSSRLKATTSAPVHSQLIKLRNSGAQLVLATAAPDLYVKDLAARLDAKVLATPSELSPDWQELLGERKASAVTEFLKEHLSADAPAHIIVFTDHTDDVPMLRLADEAYIQASQDKFNEISLMLTGTKGAPQLVHIDPLAEQVGGGYWLWMNDSPQGPIDAWEVKTILSKHRYALLYIGAGNWKPIGPGQSLAQAALRNDAPRPPSAKRRVWTHIRRRTVRDYLGVFH